LDKKFGEVNTKADESLLPFLSPYFDRDDRCASDHGRELWFPFLDEEIVQFLQQTPINQVSGSSTFLSLSLGQICDLTLPSGVGDKKILRDAAKSLGLVNSTELVKRAIQFGTRVARHTNVKYHGSNRKGKGTTLIDFDDT
jgi:asparagine synthetase B (glutamine-hydrolysing)